jgi:hypothetical protein
MWDWLSDPDNQRTLAFFGAGIAAIAGAGWALFKFMHRTPRSVTTITADRGGMAAGRDNINSSPPPPSSPTTRNK